MCAGCVSCAHCVRVAGNRELLGKEVRENLVGRGSPIASRYDHLPALPQDGCVAVEALPVGKPVAGLPDGYSQIFRSYVFGPSGFLTMAPLRYAAKFDPFLSLDCARVESVGS